MNFPALVSSIFESPLLLIFLNPLFTFRISTNFLFHFSSPSDELRLYGKLPNSSKLPWFYEFDFCIDHLFCPVSPRGVVCCTWRLKRNKSEIQEDESQPVRRISAELHCTSKLTFSFMFSLLNLEEFQGQTIDSEKLDLICFWSWQVSSSIQKNQDFVLCLKSSKWKQILEII